MNRKMGFSKRFFGLGEIKVRLVKMSKLHSKMNRKGSMFNGEKAKFKEGC